MKLATIILALLTASIFADEMPMEAQRLKLLRDNEVDKIEEKYQKALLTLRDKYAKAGRFEDAKKVDGMVVKKSIISLANQVASGDRDRLVLNWGSGGIVSLFPNGRATHTNWNNVASWKISSDGKLKIWFKSSIHTITEKSDDGSIGEVSSTKDSPTVVKLRL